MMALAEMRAIQANVVYPHHLPDGRSVSEAFTCGECALWFTGKNTAQSCFKCWKNSPPHWSILMDPKFTRIGFAISGNFAYTNVCWPSVGQGYESYRGAYMDYSVKDYEIQVKKNFVQLDSPQSQTMKTGETLQLNVKGNPFSITENRFLNVSKYELAPTDGKWESSNSTVASVNSSGKVTARKAGTATVKFYLNGDRNIYSKFTIKVTGSTKPAEPTEPKPTPKPTEPKPTQPKPTPKPTEPKPTQPKPTPKPTEPTEPQKPDTSKKINLTASVKGQDITLKWNTIPGFDSKKDRCEIQFRVNNGPLTYTSRVAELKQTTGRFDLASGKHKPGTKLKFKIRFYHPSSNSPWANNIYSGFSNEVTVVIGKDVESTPKPTEPKPVQPPAAPKIFSVSNSVRGRLTVKWHKVSGARNYRVYRKASSTGTFRLVGTTNHTFFTNQYDMKAGTTYYYQVRAVGKDANGKDVNGKFSNVVSAKCR